MRLEPGPVQFGPDPPLPTLSDRPSFEALAREEAEWTDFYLGEGDTDLQAAAEAAHQDWQPFLDTPLVEAAEGTNEALGWTPDPTIEGATEAELEIQ